MYLYNELTRKYEKELQKIADKPELSPSDLEATYKIVDILKDIETICAMKEYGDDEWSGDDWSGRRSRDSRGRYSGRSYRSGRGGYSMDNYSGHGREKMLDNLYSAMEDASSEEERMSIKALIDKMSH